MNKKHLKFLENIDYSTLADIALREKDNKDRNIYYDLATKEATLYPEDEYETVLRPLHTRLLSNGRRLETELAKVIARSLDFAYSENINEETIS